MRCPILTLAVVLLGPAVAAAGGPAPRLRVAILPVEAINLSSGEGARFQALLIRAVRAIPEAVLLEESLAGEQPGCSAEIVCQRELGARLGAHKLLSLRVGRLGDTTVLRLTAFDVTRGATQGTWQEVLRHADEPGLSSSLERMLAGIVPREAPRPAWYTRWWVWTAAAVVVSGTITAAVLATRPGTPPTDIRIVPP